MAESWVTLLPVKIWKVETKPNQFYDLVKEISR